MMDRWRQRWSEERCAFVCGVQVERVLETMSFFVCVTRGAEKVREDLETLAFV